ncbi:RNA polymerase sigma factor [Terracidiphilus gabretensis]|jgi:RNA polymerase sigma-70 factor, ECF subfamily|uniref:RNA polymerase sigma factor n=1 Tax=Terracidiphilus gabretensis TaxID=1577687 RepID=UPI0009E73DB0|nr:RNA polymerase sigma factor [Terracidiphilus gabretensis]
MMRDPQTSRRMQGAAMSCSAAAALPATRETLGSRRVTSDSSKGRAVYGSTIGPVLYSSPLKKVETGLQFHSFDASYVEKLCAGDGVTQEHFTTYFSALLQIKLRSRLRSPQAAEDVRQETFARVLTVLRRDGGLRQPERLGAFVNTVCNNVLFEQYRSAGRGESLDEENSVEPVDPGKDALEIASSRQIAVKVREILQELPARDRALLQAVFLDESEREEVCTKFGVDREYLRVLLHRAKQGFKQEYIKRVGSPAPQGAGA